MFSFRRGFVWRARVSCAEKNNNESSDRRNQCDESNSLENKKKVLRPNAPVRGVHSGSPAHNLVGRRVRATRRLRVPVGMFRPVLNVYWKKTPFSKNSQLDNFPLFILVYTDGSPLSAGYSFYDPQIIHFFFLQSPPHHFLLNVLPYNWSSRAPLPPNKFLIVSDSMSSIQSLESVSRHVRDSTNARSKSYRTHAELLTDRKGCDPPEAPWPVCTRTRFGRTVQWVNSFFSLR